MQVRTFKKPSPTRFLTSMLGSLNLNPVSRKRAVQTSQSSSIKKKQVKTPCPVFLISGHGIEMPVSSFSDRPRVPVGKTLVVFVEIGEFNLINQVNAFFEIFTDPKYLNILRDPGNNIGTLSKYFNIRVYKQGMHMPDLYTSMFGEFKLLDDQMMFFKTGLYRIPDIPHMNRKILHKLKKDMIPPEWLASSVGTEWYNSGFVGCIDAQKYNEAAYKEVYRGNLYKPAEQYSDITMKKKKKLYRWLK